MCLMKDSFLTLKDGRKLGYIEYGNPHGMPIFLLHGTPGSRIFGLEDEPILEEEGLRVITPDRPGYGQSDPLKNRTIKSFSRDVEELANYLNIEKFHVAGVSGGGPYTLACAQVLPDKVLSATLIASAAPLEMKDFFKGMSPGNKFIFKISKYFPQMLLPIYKYAAHWYRKNAEKLVDAMKPQLCEWDRKILEELESKNRMEGFVDHLREAYRQGAVGAYSDTVLVSKNWGVDFKVITTPIFMWHGESDTLVPISPAKRFSELLPNCQSHYIPGAGHFLLESEEVGRQIIQSMKNVCA